MADTYKVLVNEKQFLTFLDKLGDIFPNETYFINTAFRSKKLTDEERKMLGARAREIYLTKTIRGSDNNRVNSENALQKMYELEVPIKCLTFNKGTENEISLPQRAMTTFICCNPSDERKVALMHLAAVNDIQKNIILSNDGGVDGKNQLAHTNSDFRAERMKCNRTKWIDFDIDITNIEEISRKVVANVIRTAVKTKELCLEPLKKNIFKNPKGFIIQTAGGVHVLIDKNCLCGNPTIFCEELERWLETGGCEIKEIDFKSGPCMIPCPGVLMYDEWVVTWEEL